MYRLSSPSMVVNVVQMTMRGTPLQAVVALIREFE